MAGLDAEVTRIHDRMQLVEKVESRVNDLFALTADVERRMAEQVTRRNEIEALAHQCDSLGTRMGFAQQQLEGLSAQQARLSPLNEEVSRLGEELRGSQRALEAMKKAEASALEQQGRLAGLIEHGLRQAAETSDRLRQVQAMSQDLAQVTTRSDEVMTQLTQLQSRQRDVLSQVTLTEAQMQRAEAMSRQFDHRRSLLVHTEKALATFESRLADLDRHANGLELKMKSLADREALVHAVKAEVDGIRQISSHSKADLLYVAEHRKDVSDIRVKVEDLLGRIGDTDEKIALIESWRRNVEEARASASAVTSMFSEMQGTLESLSEQRVVVDDVGEKLARLDFTVQEAQNTLSRLDSSAQEAQNTLRTLQREREVAERVEKSIKAVRAGSSRPAAS
jgi:chromosome segregation ATPase